MDEATFKEVALYIENADESLSVAQLDLDNDFNAAAVNRAYYAIFYAANALLATKKLPAANTAAFYLHFANIL